MRGWALLAIYIAGYDTFARITLSREYRETFANHPVTVSLVTAYILFHLTGALPEKLDLLRFLGRVPGQRHDRADARARPARE